MHPVLKRFLNYKREMGTFSAVAIKVFAVVTMFLQRVVKHLLRLLYLRTYLRKVGQLKGRTIFINKLLDVNVIEEQRIVFNIKPLLREIKCLLNEISISIIHL